MLTIPCYCPAGSTEEYHLKLIHDFLRSHQYYHVYKNPKEWGADELWFTIVPYKQILPTPGQITATKKYAPTASLDPTPRRAYWKAGIGPDEFLTGRDKGDVAMLTKGCLGPKGQSVETVFLSYRTG